MQRLLRTNRGLTLIELLVALVISAVIIAAAYRTFMGQQKTYTVQEQVVEMRQNARAAISNMMRELRMTGFGSVSAILPATFGSGPGAVTCPNVVNANMPSTGWITVVGALISDSQEARLTATISTGNAPVIAVSSLTDANGTVLFDTGSKKYISIGGVEGHTITNISTSNKQLTLGERLIYKHKADTRVYPIRAISYQAGVRNENTGGAEEQTAENIESVQFEYLDAQGNPATSDAAVQMIRVRVTATTDMADPQYKSGDGHRKREISSNVQLRNVILAP
jgi:prepilin-type N-terminal cleavage/methylation domain-containing protein